MRNITDDQTTFSAKDTIDAQGKLITPGFVDTHVHITDVIGDYDNAPEYLEKDSIQVYKSRIADTHLPYGTTTIADMGQPENWMNETIQWQQSPSAEFPNFILTGSALISDEQRQPYVSHTEVVNP